MMQQTFLKDVGITSQSTTLRAAETGLACCILGSFNKDSLFEALGLDEKYTIQLVIAVGKGIENIRLVEPGEDGEISYYRDENNVHYAPKRKLEDDII